MAGKSITLTPVDSGALRQLLSAKGQTISGLAKEMGYSANWIDVNKGLRPAVVSYLKAVYQIQPEQYKRGTGLKTEGNLSVQRSTVQNGFIDALDKTSVRNYFKGVCMSAIDEYLRQDGDKIKKLIISAVEEALK